LYHIAALAVAEDIPGHRVGVDRVGAHSRKGWGCGVVLCILVSGGCAQIKGQLIALLCTTSWSMVGAAALVPYLALVLCNTRHAVAAWCSAVSGFGACLFWYLCVNAQTAVVPSLLPGWQSFPPFFAGLACSLAGWALGLALAHGIPSLTPGRAVGK
ncbi:hypothetical protein LJC23_07700, partial [Desulfovibrio sp. OttesenSCG-928-I05]|nr:hypothetical protein [Desulfovibrio sp. OttesenSCG-928-I05]